MIDIPAAVSALRAIERHVATAAGSDGAFAVAATALARVRQGRWPEVIER